MTPTATYELTTRQGLTLLRLRLLKVPLPNALTHLKLHPQRGYKPEWNGHLGVDLTGRTFGRLTVVRRAADDYLLSRETQWSCRCACGNPVIVRRSSLVSANTKSCGCLQREAVTKAGYKHGHNSKLGPQSPEYRSWAAMLHLYRHVTCKRWHAFEAFLEDVGPKPAGARLKRLKLHRGYRASNVVWR